MNSHVAWAYEDRLREAANRRGEMHWVRYTEEILDQLGVRAELISFSKLRPNTLEGRRALILGDYSASAFPPNAAAALEQWVRAGGILIGLGTTGFDELFGVRPAGEDVCVPPFTLAGWMSLKGRDEAAELLDELLPETACPIMAPFRRLAVTDATALTELWEGDGTDVDPGCPASRRSPAVTRRILGQGRAHYFAFSLPQAIWAYHHGRPITRDFDGDGYLRTGDHMIVGARPTAAVPCADVALQILERMLAPAGVPFVDQLPPHEGGVPDALFHYGGDDEAAAGLQVRMSEIMKSFGLGYHVNVMLGGDDRFHFSDEDRAVYEANRHEFSLHFNFVEWPKGVKHPAPIEEAEFDRQYRCYIERYGKPPICANTHFLRDSGWADMARFGAACGILGENIRVHYTLPPMDPVNLFGTPFGTVYPHFVYEDAEHGNVRLKFVTIPVGFYEPGSPSGEERHPYRNQDPYQPREYRRIVELACHYGWTLNLFMHPTHMSSAASRGQDALRCMLDRIRELGARVAHVGTDALCLWWHARSATRLTCAEQEQGGRFCYDIMTDHRDGVFVRFLEAAVPQGVRLELDGQAARVERRVRRGDAWLYVWVPVGGHRLNVST